MNKKKIVIITSVIVLLILAILGASYAYYSATVKENNKTQTVIKTNELEIVYTGTQEINVEGIVPGDSFTKKFTIENTSNIPVTYNIYLEGITNEFNEDLVYILKDKDGIVIEEEVLPSTNTSKTYLITDIEIDASEIKEYEMTIEFKYSDKDQNKLQGKNFIATLGVDTTPVKIVKVVNDKIKLDKLNNGDTVTKTFSVKNLSKETQSYDVSLSDVVSTYGDNLTYSLTKNGSEVISNETMPSSDTTILESQIINANTTDEYVMTIKFDNITAALEYILAVENDEFSANIVIIKVNQNIEETKKLSDIVLLGDYVKMTPTVTSYEIDKNITGYTGVEQNILNPSELNIWRVIKKNENGTIELVSEYVSSTSVYFGGLTGYKNYVGSLKTIAKQYENSKYTINSRCVGYNNQTEYITDTSKFTKNAPWTSNTINNTNELSGGGDTLYKDDLDLIQGVLKTLGATDINMNSSYYWISSRNYLYDGSAGHRWALRVIDNKGVLGISTSYSYWSNSFHEDNKNSAIRPILTLKSDISGNVLGDGTKEKPYELK